MQNMNLRIIDANFNRAREALRVMEDYARFGLNDSFLTLRCKTLRHDLCQAVAQLPACELLAARDTPHDVGTELSTDTERRREDFQAVVAAAAKRLTEALRCLEEYGKIENTAFAQTIEKIRYQGYDLEKQILLRTNLIDLFRRVRLYVLLTESLCKKPLLETVRLVLAGGADCIQLREKTKSDREVLYLSQKIADMCHEAGVLFILNDRSDLAVLAGADGVHLGQDDLPAAAARKVLGHNMLVGKSTHSLKEAEAALAEGADYLAVGSIFGSATKPQVERGGLELVRAVRVICDRPLIAIGGMDESHAAEALAAGATGVAVCQAIAGADDPREATRSIKAKLEPEKLEYK